VGTISQRCGSKGLREKEAGLGSVRAIFAGAEHGRVPVLGVSRNTVIIIHSNHTLRYGMPCHAARLTYTVDVA